MLGEWCAVTHTRTGLPYEPSWSGEALPVSGKLGVLESSKYNCILVHKPPSQVSLPTRGEAFLTWPCDHTHLPLAVIPCQADNGLRCCPHNPQPSRPSLPSVQ